MNCQEFQDRLSEYVDGTLEPAVRESFCLHNTGCPECREELSLFESAMAAVDDAFPELEPSPLFVAKVWERIRQEPEARPGWLAALSDLLRWRPNARLTLAFASMVLVVSGFFIYPAARDYQQGQQVVEVALSEVLPDTETRLTTVKLLPAVPDPELVAVLFDEETDLPDMQLLGNPLQREMEETDQILESL